MRPLLVFPGLLFLSLLARAAFASPCVPAEVHIDPAHQFITLRVTFPVGVDRLALDDYYGYSRSQLWHSPNGSARITDNALVLSRASNRTAILRMDVRQNVRRPDRAYRPFLRFGDGSVAVYSGNFAVAAKGSGHLCLRYVAAPGESVVGYGQVSKTTIKAPDQGGYVVFGEPHVVRTDGIILVLDRAAPEWIAQRVTTIVPAVNRYFTQELWPVTQPVVVLWAAPELTGFNGDHLEASITLGVYGDQWNKPNQSAAAQLLHFLAHELFHSWNAGKSFNTSDETGLLALEGGADAASDIAKAVAAGKSANKAWLQAVNDAYNACLAEIPPDESLAKRLREPSPNRLPYDCGNAILFLLAGSTPKHDPTTTYFAMWRRVHARKADRSYTWQDLAPSDADSTVLVALAGAIEQPGTFERNTAAAFAADHYGVQPDPDPTMAERTSAARALVAWAMREDCGGVGFWTQPDGFLLDPSLHHCKSLRVGEKVTGMLGHDLRTDPWKLAENVQALCAQHHFIEVDYQGSTPPTRFACGNPPPDLLRPARITQMTSG